MHGTGTMGRNRTLTVYSTEVLGLFEIGYISQSLEGWKLRATKAAGKYCDLRGVLIA